MIYELHLTVDHKHPDFSPGDWIEFCRNNNAKPLDIRLASGKHTRQVMFAAVHQGDEGSMRRWKGGLTGAVCQAGFSVLRSKLEVPLDKSAPYEIPVYHEAHIKSLIPKNEVENVVESLLEQYWIASWNHFFPRDAGLEKWYFTWRAYGVPFIQAGREFAEAYAALTEVNWHTVRMECETVIEDSNEALDEGWA